MPRNGNALSTHIYVAYLISEGSLSVSSMVEGFHPVYLLFFYFPVSVITWFRADKTNVRSLTVVYVIIKHVSDDYGTNYLHQNAA